MNYTLLVAPLLLAACASTHQNPPQPTHAYVCDGAYTAVQASYPNAKTALVTVPNNDGNLTYTLHQVTAANGVKYHTSKARTPSTGHFVWWTNANQAIFYTTASSASQPDYIYEKQLATCTLVPNPTANTATK
jgi:membrane-bound inhibitor of C-type lysozyme